jgi:hypothetical protein
MALLIRLQNIEKKYAISLLGFVLAINPGWSEWKRTRAVILGASH